MRPKHEVFWEIVLQDGVEFVAQVVVLRSGEAIDKLTRWYKPFSIPALSHLDDYYHRRMDEATVGKMIQTYEE